MATGSSRLRTPPTSRDPRRIYLEWQWTEDGDMWRPCGASFIHPSVRYGDQYVARIARPPSPASDRGDSEPESIDDDEL